MGTDEPQAAIPGDATLAAYETAAHRYREQSSPPGPAVTAYLDRLADLVGTGTVFELGSGPGWDAAYLERRGSRVIRTDAAPAFVAMMRADGYEARLLDVRVDELGGPYGGVLADAVLLHLTRQQFVDVLRRARLAVVDAGILAFTVKEGDGEAWSEAKLDLPRHFPFWREPEVRAALQTAGWAVLSVEHVAGRTEPWLFVFARWLSP
ncbi:MAG TPA: class I SAM-dependent methyltransferase [Pseudonocardiaceae bacterium]|nr:class I SAM-dependent methyltransferase [Pseudonocardiaceae bacterium]